MENGAYPRIGLAADHAGYEIKEFIRTLLDKRDIPHIDFGTYTSESANYAEYGHKLANAIEKGEVSTGIAICGSGNGMNMTLNKHAVVRAALCWNKKITTLARLHNDANVLVLPGRFLTIGQVEDIIDIFLNTLFEGGRHQERIEEIPIRSIF
jgi:ribose 5-phosphate isomerase B